VTHPGCGLDEYCLERGPTSPRRKDRSTHSSGQSIGKASVTGYCIRFKRLSDINVHALQAAIRDGMTIDQTGGAQP